MDNEFLVGILSFFVCFGYTALNETAAELEHPLLLAAQLGTQQIRSQWEDEQGAAVAADLAFGADLPGKPPGDGVEERDSL